MVDTVPANTGTTARLTLDRSVYGDIDTAGDRDWYRVDLTAGQTYEFRLHGIGTGQLADPVVRLRRADGVEIASNNDAGTARWDGTNERDSFLQFTAQTTGVYYVDVGENGDNATGRFLLTAATQNPNGMVFTPDEISWQSTNNYPIAFGGIDAAAWDLRTFPGLTVNITNLTAEGQNLARNALQAWTDASGIVFSETSETANINFFDGAAGVVAEGNYMVSPTSRSTITSATVQISTGFLAQFGTGLNSYSYETYIHEIGHALGLGHAGNYNAPADFNDAYYLNDSLAYSIMSYMQVRNDEFSRPGTPEYDVDSDNPNVNADFRFMLTPAMADVISMRNLYPYLQRPTRPENNTYGFAAQTNNAVLNQAYLFGADMFMNIVDSGGYDILNFSNTNASQTINLNAESMSGVWGGVSNLTIARGVVIEEARGGSGPDIIYGNEVANMIYGNGGIDNLAGYGGNDDVYGGDGEDNLKGGGGNDYLYGGAGADFLDGEDDIDEAIYSDSTVGVDVRLGLNGGRGAGLYGTAQGDRLVDIENITGSNYNDYLAGNEGANVLKGGGGDDTLNGRQGADSFLGSDGSDSVTYVDAEAGVTVNLLTGLGSRGEAEGDAYESIESVGGSSYDDIFVLGPGANFVNGYGGQDRVDYSSATSNVYIDLDDGSGFGAGYGSYAAGDAYIGIENLTGSIYADELTGNGFANELAGGDGNDAIDGMLGADRLSGGKGDDTFYVDNAGDVVVEASGEGTDDRVVVTVSYALAAGQDIESLLTSDRFGTGAINLTGNAKGQTLTGNSGANLLDGRAGADTMTGGAGADVYIVDNPGDRVVELASDAGIDTVLSVATFSLDGTGAENLTLAGSANVNATGNGVANALTGNSGANLLDGKGGADTMKGGVGADVYIVDNPGDKVVEVASDAGTDTVLAVCSFSLDGTAAENLILAGSADISALGNALANALTGNSGANILNGGTGADTMTGGAGSDTYVVENAGDRCIEANGAAGIDTVLSTTSYSLAGSHLENLTLVGGANIYGLGNSIANTITGNGGANLIDGMGGRDTLTGNGGADTFLFRNIADSTATGSGQDVIQDFSRAQGDRIDLSLIDANAGLAGDQGFSFIGSAGFSNKAGELRVVSGTNSLVLGDVNGDAAPDFAIILIGNHVLRAMDFVL